MEPPCKLSSSHHRATTTVNQFCVKYFGQLWNLNFSIPSQLPSSKGKMARGENFIFPKYMSKFCITSYLKQREYFAFECATCSIALGILIQSMLYSVDMYMIRRYQLYLQLKGSQHGRFLYGQSITQRELKKKGGGSTN